MKKSSRNKTLDYFQHCSEKSKEKKKILLLFLPKWKISGSVKNNFSKWKITPFWPFQWAVLFKYKSLLRQNHHLIKEIILGFRFVTFISVKPWPYQIKPFLPIFLKLILANSSSTKATWMWSQVLFLFSFIRWRLQTKWLL